MTDQRKRVLFFAEAVTLAHVARPLVLAKALDVSRYEVHFACADRFDFCFAGANFRRWPIQSMPPDRFLQKLAAGTRLYDENLLRRYVDEDLRLIDAVRPDLIVGDFRLSLAVSATVRKVPYTAITNAHWSPYSAVSHFPLPDHPLARFIGISAASLLFRLFQPAVFAFHADPLNRLRRKHSLPPLGNLRHVYSHGDYTLYADTPGLVPTSGLPDNHRYIGPILWSPEIKLPAWWDAVPTDKPCIYVTLGSSGRVDVLPAVIEALGQMPIYVLLATAGRAALGVLPSNVFAAEYLPGSQAAARSRLVVCNGGSATVYQALAQGVPVLGIASNMDQHLTMSAVCNAKAGLLVRCGNATRRIVKYCAETLLLDLAYRTGAEQVAQEFASFDAPSRFGAFVREILTAG